MEIILYKNTFLHYILNTVFKLKGLIIMDLDLADKLNIFIYFSIFLIILLDHKKYISFEKLLVRIINFLNQFKRTSFVNDLIMNENHVKINRDIAPAYVAQYLRTNCNLLDVAGWYQNSNIYGVSNNYHYQIFIDEKCKRFLLKKYSKNKDSLIESINCNNLNSLQKFIKQKN